MYDTMSCVYAPCSAKQTISTQQSIKGQTVLIWPCNTPTRATPPTLQQPVMLPDGAFQFTFTNYPGTTFTVLAGADLSLQFSNWTVLGPAQEVSPGQFQFTDLQATNYPQRFYNVRSP